MNNVQQAPQKINAAPKKKKKASSLDARKSRAGWLFVLPFIIGFVIIYAPIVYDSILYSFTKINIVTGGGFRLTWVGLENYQEALFVDATFVQTLTAGIQQLIFDIPAIVIFSLFMAVMLNEKMVGRAAFRAIFFIPVILSTGLIDKIDQQNQMLQYMENTSSMDMGDGGAEQSAQIISAMDVQRLFRNMVIGEELLNYVVGLVNDIYDIVNRSGVQMLIFLSALQSISPAIYESCQIDGATTWETFWKITLPMISPMILVNTVYTVIDSFTSADNQVMTYIDQVYDQPSGNVLSSAMSWMYFIIVMLIIAAVAGVLSAYTFYQRQER
ncbi:MAG: sugar ABC transporter permease [Ruminococcaceae bacterium]|nr:sugar ABC transporter permease [Oscillospiraceae bacterium]